jgi:hypothetical protein
LAQLHLTVSLHDVHASQREERRNGLVLPATASRYLRHHFPAVSQMRLDPGEGSGLNESRAASGSS